MLIIYNTKLYMSCDTVFIPVVHCPQAPLLHPCGILVPPLRHAHHALPPFYLFAYFNDCRKGAQRTRKGPAQRQTKYNDNSQFHLLQHHVVTTKNQNIPPQPLPPLFYSFNGVNTLPLLKEEPSHHHDTHDQVQYGQGPHCTTIKTKE